MLQLWNKLTHCLFLQVFFHTVMLCYVNAIFFLSIEPYFLETRGEQRSLTTSRDSKLLHGSLNIQNRSQTCAEQQGAHGMNRNCAAFPDGTRGPASLQVWSFPGRWAMQSKERICFSIVTKSILRPVWCLAMLAYKWESPHWFVLEAQPSPSTRIMLTCCPGPSAQIRLDFLRAWRSRVWDTQGPLRLKEKLLQEFRQQLSGIFTITALVANTKLLFSSVLYLYAREWGYTSDGHSWLNKTTSS